MTGPIARAVLSLTLLQPASDPEAAQRAVERAKVHVAAGEYDLASAALAEAHALDPNPALLYARAQAERFGGHCATALELYRAFLAEDPPPEDRVLAERYVRECEVELRRRGAPLPSPEPKAIALPEEPSTQLDGRGADDPASDVEQPRDRTLWMTDVAGGLLVGSGVVGLAVGAGLTGRAHVLDRDADRDVGDQDAFAARLERAVVLNRAGLATLGVGSALVLAGIIRYAVVGSRARRSARNAVGWFGPPAGARGGGLILIHRF